MYSENDIIRWNEMRVKGLYFHHHNVETIQEGFTRTRKKHISKIGICQGYEF